jgi:hypothetical protein
MSNCRLLADSEKYGGKYVATKSFKSKKVICASKDLTKVYKDALKKGAKEPVVYYVPKKGMPHIY